MPMKQADMKNLDYEMYLANPEIRAAIEQEARRARAKAFDQYVIEPLINVFGRLFNRAALQRTPDSSFPVATPDVWKGI
jgi:hypothetical protein